MSEFIKRFDFRISITYGVIATLWIIISDSLAAILLGNNHTLENVINIFKGLGFVVVTTLALYFVLSTELRKRAHIEHELQLERDISPVAILVFDIKGRISYVNMQAEKILGLPRTEIIGQPFNAPTWHVSDYDGNPILGNYPGMSKMMESRETIYGIQQAIEVTRGKRILLEINLAPIFDNAGTLTSAVATFNDVTSARTQERRVRESEESLKRAQSIAHVGDWTWNTQTNNVRASDELYHIFDLDRATFTGQLDDIMEHVIHPDDREHIMEAIGSFLNEQRSGPLAFRIIWSDGSVRHVWAEADVPVTDAKGNIVSLSGIVQDITERKQVEQAFVESEARYRALVEQASDGIFIVNSEGHYIDVNSAGCVLTGYTREEILQLNLKDIIKVTANSPLRLKDLQYGNTILIEREMLRKDGSTVPVEIGAKRLLDGSYQGIARDITQRKQVEKALHESEARYRMLVEQASDAIFIAEIDGYYTEVNSAGCSLLGYTREEILQKKMLDLFIITQEKLLRYEELLQGKTLLSEREMLRKDGARVIVEVSSKLLHDGTVQAIARDISERKQIEQEIRLKSAALEAAANGIMITDINGTIEWINPAFTNLTGYNLDEALGKNPRDLVRSGQHNDSFYKERWNTILAGDVWHGELVNRRKNGSLYTQEETITPVRNQSGEISHFIAIQQDISQRKLTEAAIYNLNTELEKRVNERTTQLNHIKNRIESILNSNADSLVYSRIDGTIEQVNPAFSKTFGYYDDEILLQPLTNLVIPKDVPNLDAIFASVIMNRCAQQVDVIAARKDGKIFEAAMTLSPVIENSEHLVGVVLSVHDVTNRNHMLHQAMDLSELKSRYVSMAAHDLRNPMAVILTSSDTLQHYNDRLTDDKKLAKFDQIRTSIKNMTDILDDILIMGQVDSGKIDFRPAPLDIVAFCQTLVAEIIQATGTSIRIDFSTEGIDNAVAMDAKLLRHILGNLLSNAIKYSPVDSSVLFTACNRDNQLAFRIQDHGIGIPKMDHARLFETFFRASNAKNIRGTGLGLAIVKQSAELHGGSITFESEEDCGTTFIVTLPLVVA